MLNTIVVKLRRFYHFVIQKSFYNLLNIRNWRINCGKVDELFDCRWAFGIQYDEYYSSDELSIYFWKRKITINFWYDEEAEDWLQMEDMREMTNEEAKKYSDYLVSLADNNTKKG